MWVLKDTIFTERSSSYLSLRPTSVSQERQDVGAVGAQPTAPGPGHGARPALASTINSGCVCVIYIRTLQIKIETEKSKSKRGDYEVPDFLADRRIKPPFIQILWIYKLQKDHLLPPVL